MDTKPDFDRFLREIEDHFVHVVEDRLRWQVLEQPQRQVGNGSVVLRFLTPQGRFIFRVPQFSQEQLRAVMLAYRYLGASGMMPEKLYHDGKCIVEQFIDGAPLSGRSADAVLQALARRLATIHAMPATGFGPLLHTTHGRYPDAQAWLEDAGGRVAPRDQPQWHDEELGPDEIDSLLALHAQAARAPRALAAAPTCLGHGDLWRRNIVATPEGVVKLIDWDGIGAYPREHDFAFMAEADLDARQQEVVLAAYGQPLDPSLLRWFSLRKLVGKRQLRGRDMLRVAGRHGLLQDVRSMA